GALELRDRGLPRERQAVLFQARRVVDGEARALELHVHAGELVLNGLELRERLAELPAFLHVLRRVVERVARNTDHLRADPDAALVQRIDRDLVSLAHVADDVLGGHLDVLERERERGGRADSELVLFLALVEALPLRLDEESGDALVALALVDAREDEEQLGLEAVRDPELAAVQEVAVALRRRRRREGERVGARPGLRQRIRGDLLLRELRKILFLQSRRGPAQDRVVHEGVLDVHDDGAGRVDAGERLDDGDGRAEVRAEAAELLRDLDSHEIEVEELPDEVRVHDVRLVHLAHFRADRLQGEVIDAFSQLPLVVGEDRHGRNRGRIGDDGHRTSSVDGGYRKRDEPGLRPASRSFWIR